MICPDCVYAADRKKKHKCKTHGCTCQHGPSGDSRVIIVKK